MKLPIPTLFLAVAATALQAATAEENLFGGSGRVRGSKRGSKGDKNSDDKEPRSLGGFGPYGICTDTYPTLDLSQAYQPLNVPEQVYPDEDGVTRVQMIFGLAHYKGASFDTILRVHDAVAPGKTIHAVPGGRIELELINCLREPLGFNGPEAKNKFHIPNSTNIHTHGPHISGASPGDNVFLNLGPGNSSYYVYEFNENHMPGTFWYHPHLHGSSALQVGQGAAGMLIVDHPKDYEIPDAIMDMPEHQMVFQHLSLDLLRDASAISDDKVTNWVDQNFNMTNVTTDLTNFMLVNMQFLPEVTMEVDKWYRWRMAMSSVRESISFLSQSGNCEFQLLAKDGIYLADAPRTVPAVILSPGNKADVAVRCSEIGLEYMNTTNLAFNPDLGRFNPETQYAQSAAQEDMEYPDVPDLVGNFHDPELQPVVMVINVIALAGGMMPDDDLEPFTVPTPCYLVDLRDLDEDDIDGTFINEYWCKSPGVQQWPRFSDPDDTCGVFGPYGVGGGFNPGNQSFENLIPYSDSSTYINDFEVGSIQEIDLRGVIFHPYHQHINPFQIQGIFNPIPGSPEPATYTAEAVKIWYQVGDWQDTLQYPSLTLDGRTRATFAKIRFQVDQFTGHMLQHCHLLFHEDQGMMAQYDMRGDEGTTWDGARDIDRTCIKPTAKKGLNTTSQPSDQLSESPSFSATPSSLPSANPSLMDNKLLISMNPSTTGTGKWYVSFPDEYCLQDCKHSGAGSCGGLAKKWDILYNDAASCCETKLPYKNLGWCTGTSLGNSFPGSGKFYVDQIKQTCTKDCVSGGPLDGDSECGEIIEDAYVDLYDSIIECCRQKLSWQNVNLCASSFNPSGAVGSGQWYVDWELRKCVKDCVVGGTSCGGLKDNWDVGHATAETCCAMISWVPRDQCHT